jgi:glycogen(starch) synthase
MHILVTADCVGGVWTYARELVTGLIQKGNRVTLVSFGEIPTPAQTQWMEGLEQLDFRPSAFRLEWMQDSEADLAESAEYLQRVVDEVAPEVLHLNQFYYGALDVDVPKVVVAHSDVVSWWAEVHKCEPPASNWMRWYRRTVSRGLEGATEVVAPSQWMLDALKRHYVEPGNARVIYNGRNPKLFHPYNKKQNRVLCVGRLWDLGKNVSILTRINSDVPVEIIGPERNPDALEQEKKAVAGVGEGKVSTRGPQPEAELAALFADAGIYAAVSRYEPFGLAPLEAALSRCALVASDIPSFRELWGEAAVYFKSNDAASLETAIRMLASDEGLRDSYGKKAFERALRCFNSERMVNDYLGLYGSVVSSAAMAA